VGVGESAPQRWLDEKNRRNQNSPDTPWPTDWGTFNYKWTLVYRVNGYYSEWEGLRGGAIVNPSTRIWTFTDISTQATEYNGFITTVEGYRVTVYDASVGFGPDPFAATYYGGGVYVGHRIDRPYFERWITFPKAPTITLVSATRTA
jgi:hypothetical protein